MDGRFVPDSKGFDAVLMRPELAAILRSAAERIAVSVASESGMETVVDDYNFHATTRAKRRVASVVVVKHPLARRREAAHGFLTRAAGANGYEVGSRS